MSAGRMVGRWKVEGGRWKSEEVSLRMWMTVWGRRMRGTECIVSEVPYAISGLCRYLPSGR